MAMFTDTVTIFSAVTEDWLWDTFCFDSDVIGGCQRRVVEGVQWSDKMDKRNGDGIISVARYAVITFPEGTYENLELDVYQDGDCIVYGAVTDVVDGTRGNRVSDLLKRYPKSGTIQSVNDNSNRDFLKNFKVVIA